MPVGGENIGRAYIAILADGNALDESIRKQFDDSEPTFQESGRSGYQEFRKGWEKEGKKTSNQNFLRHSITDALARGDYLENTFFRSKTWRDFRAGMGKNFKDAGRLAVDNLESELRRGANFETIADKIRNMTPEITKARKQLLDKEFAMERDETNRVRSLYDRLATDIDKFTGGARGARGRNELLNHLRDMRKVLAASGPELHDFTDGIDDLDRRVRFANPNLVSLRGHILRFGDATGRAFGRGSRNDFLNFFGSLVGNLVKVGAAIPFALDKISDMGRAIGGAFTRDASSGVEQTSRMGAAFSSMGSAIASSLPAVVGAGVVLAALAVIIGPLVALMGGLVGIVVALASSLSGALIGAVGALAGLLGPASIGVAVLASAFIGLDKAAKKVLKHDFRPVVAGFHELQRQARIPIFAGLEEQGRRFGAVIRTWGPLFREVGQAISNVGDYFLDALQSPGFTKFSDSMRLFLPDAVESLGRSFGNFLGGMGGVFRSLIPITQEFLRWLERITGDFAKWANSDEGQDKLMRFWRDTADSLHSVWNFLKAVGGLMRQLFRDSKKTGDNIFDDMARGVRRFTNYLKDNPKAVRRFFGDVHDLAKDLGDLVRNIGRFADALDNVQSRKGAQLLIEGLAWAFIALTGPAILSAQALGLIVDSIDKLSGKIGKVDWGQTFKDMGKEMLDALDFVTSTRIVHTVEHGLGNAARAGIKAFGKGWNSAGNKATRDLLSSIGKLPGKIGHALAGVPGTIRKHIGGNLRGIGLNGVLALAGPFNGIGARIGSKVSGVPGRVRSLLSKLPGIGRSISSGLSNAFSTVKGKIGGFVSGVPGRVRGILSVLGGIGSHAASAVGNAFSGIVGKIAGHFSGLASSIGGKLNDAVGTAKRVAGDVVSAFSGLAGRIVNAIGSITIHPHIDWPSIKLPKSASGGVFEGLRGIGIPRTIGEDGREAVVPLDRPLNQVDPSVRWLSAVAQGKAPGMASGGIPGSGRTVNINEGAITVISPSADPRAVSQRLLDKIVAAAY